MFFLFRQMLIKIGTRNDEIRSLLTNHKHVKLLSCRASTACRKLKARTFWQRSGRRKSCEILNCSVWLKPRR